MSRDSRGEAMVRGGGRGADIGLWFAFLGGAAAWSVHIFGGWLLDEVAACAPGALERGSVMGLDVRVWLFGLTAVTAAAAAATAVVGYRRWALVRAEEDDARAGRVAFMGFAGVLQGILFLVIIVLGGVQLMGASPCGS